MKITFDDLHIEMDLDAQFVKMGGVEVHFNSLVANQLKKMVAEKLHPEKVREIVPLAAPAPTKQATGADKIRAKWKIRLAERKALGLCIYHNRKPVKNKLVCAQCIKQRSSAGRHTKAI